VLHLIEGRGGREFEPMLGPTSIRAGVTAPGTSCWMRAKRTGKPLLSTAPHLRGRSPSWAVTR